MENSKLFTRLRLFSTEEISDLILFANSPYHNTNAALIRLLKYLKKCHPDLQGKRVRKELVFKKIYPEKEVYREKRMNELMTNLHQLSEEFLVHDRLKKTPAAHARQALLAYRDHGMHRDFLKTVGKTESILANSPQDEENTLYRYLLNKEIFYHPTTERQKPGMPSLTAALDNLDLFFAKEKISLSLPAKNREKLLNEKHEIRLLKEVQDELIDQVFKENRVLTFMNKVLRLSKKISDLELKNLIKEYNILFHIFNFRQRQDFLGILINASSNKFRNGNKEISAVILSLYQVGLKQNLLIENGQMHETVFSNILLTAKYSGEHNWAADFVKEYQKTIVPTQNKNDAINIAEVTYLISMVSENPTTSNINDALIIINELKFSDINYTYRAKSILLRLYYYKFIEDENYYEFLVDFIVAYEKQLLRNKIMNKSKSKMIIEFVRITKRIALAIVQKNKEGIEKIRVELIEKEGVFLKNWLIERTGEALIRI